MFAGARTFDQTLHFDTSSVERMASMFEHSAAFNNGGVTLEFDTTRVRDMSRMFRCAVAFQQDAMLSDMGHVTQIQHMLFKCGPLARIITTRVNRLAVGFTDISGRISDVSVATKPLRHFATTAEGAEYESSTHIRIRKLRIF